MKNSDFFILTVPTPITNKNKPDLSILKQAAMTIAKVLKKEATIILESTVYPGVTEDFLVPIIEKLAKLKHKKDFFVSYSQNELTLEKRNINLLILKKLLAQIAKLLLIK